MSNYPEKEVLLQKLKSNCNDEKLCEAVAVKFAGKKISCNHRVAQRGTFEVGGNLKASDNDMASCAKTLCDYVDQSQCSL